jgi:nucleoid-associated protein YgaU
MSERTVVVKGGDTLSAIALREMGRADLWPKLFARNEANIVTEQMRRNIGRVVPRYNPEDWIFPGMTLTIPVHSSPVTLP